MGLSLDRFTVVDFEVFRPKLFSFRPFLYGPINLRAPVRVVP